MAARIELLVEEKDGGVVLVSPAVGLFTCARGHGHLLAAGQLAGVLEVLGVPHTLVVPAGVAGRVVSQPPEQVHEPVGYRTPLYELAPLEDAVRTQARSEERTFELAVRAPHSGRFWHRPAPSDPAFVAPGDVVTAGSTLGLIEVMKTFTHLHYRPESGLPERARIVKLLVPDGGEVSLGDALAEVAPAD